MGTKMMFDSGSPGARSPYLGRHRKTPARPSWPIGRRSQHRPGTPGQPELSWPQDGDPQAPGGDQAGPGRPTPAGPA